jgi:RES domain-containing protein
VYRHYAPAYAALSGEGARRIGGRWNAPESFSVIYTGSSVETVDAEFRRSVSSARMPVTNPRELARIRLDLTRVLDLRSEATRRALGIGLEDIIADDPTIPRAIGEAAQHLGYEAIVAPSATGIGHVVAVFLTNRSPESSIEVIETQVYDPAVSGDREA